MTQFLPYLAWIETQYNPMISLIEKWASINSWSNHLPGLNAMCATLEKDFSVLGGEMQTIELPPRQTLDSQGNQIILPLGKAISIKKRPQAPTRILLAGHMDTVYPPTHPFQKVEKENDFLKGPGTADMKGGLAVLLKALEAFEQSRFTNTLGWEIIINPDEEIGSPGSYGLFVEAAKRNHAGLIFEPSMPDGAFVSGRKGSANYIVVAKGRPAHAGRDFHEGRSAIYAMAHFIHELEKLNSEDITINVGYIEGGGQVNIVPELCISRFNMRSRTEKAMNETRKKIMELIFLCKKRDGIELEYVQDSFRLPKPFDAKTQSLFQTFRKCAEELHIPFELRESGGVCDGNILSAEGLPTIDSIGPIGVNIHTDKEYLVLSSLVERAKLAALFLFMTAESKI